MKSVLDFIIVGLHDFARPQTGHRQDQISSTYDSNRAMIRQICNVKPENVLTVKSNQLLARLEIADLDIILWEKTASLGDLPCVELAIYLEGSLLMWINYAPASAG